MFIGPIIGRYPIQSNGLATEHFACAAKNSVCFCSNISYSCGIIRVVQVMQVLGRRNFCYSTIEIIEKCFGEVCKGYKERKVFKGRGGRIIKSLRRRRICKGGI